MYFFFPIVDTGHWLVLWFTVFVYFCVVLVSSEVKKHSSSSSSSRQRGQWPLPECIYSGLAMGSMGVQRIHTTVEETLYSRMIESGTHFTAALDLGARILLGDIPHPNDLMVNIAKYQMRLAKSEEQA